jgi:putative FmdB family regulatory protein
MPIYEFKCESCGTEFEKLCEVDEDADDCPDCDDPDIKRLISKTSFKLKGSGWWETDYNQSDDEAPADAPEAESETDSDDGDVDGNSAEATA